jgi:hypothetical protein
VHFSSRIWRNLQSNRAKRNKIELCHATTVTLRSRARMPQRGTCAASASPPPIGRAFRDPACLKDRLGDQRGGSEWEPIIIVLQRENSVYAPNSQPRIPTRVCQGSVVIADLPTLGANPKRSQSENETQRAKDLAAQHWTRRTVCKHRADHPRGLGRLSADTERTVREA